MGTGWKVRGRGPGGSARGGVVFRCPGREQLFTARGGRGAKCLEVFCTFCSMNPFFYNLVAFGGWVGGSHVLCILYNKVSPQEEVVFGLPAPPPPSAHVCMYGLGSLPTPLGREK